MKRIGKDFLITAGLIVALTVLYFLAKGISMIPIENGWTFIKNYWPGMIGMLLLDYVGRLISAICFAEEEKHTVKDN
jgi:hypothetical protein